jgi:hypothetical protein
MYHRLHCIRSCPDSILFVTHCLLKLPFSFVSVSGLGFDSIFFFVIMAFLLFFVQTRSARTASPALLARLRSEMIASYSNAALDE